MLQVKILILILYNLMLYFKAKIQFPSYLCRIHDVKPEQCRKYSKSRKHAEETGCKAFD